MPYSFFSSRTKSAIALTSVSLFFFGSTNYVVANPKNGDVVAGNATITTPNTDTTVINQQTQNVVINWDSFNIGKDETTQFVQPNSDAWALNRITGSSNPSVIEGNLTANGNIAIVNPDGILFSRGSRIDVNSLIATTADISNKDFMQGNLNFNIGGNTSASIINEGNISIGEYGLAAFVAPGLRNSGVITARLGSVSLASGNSFTLDFYGDGLVNLAFGDEIVDEVYDVSTGKAISDMVKNEGIISAEGGTVALTAATARRTVNSVINNTGVIEANTVGMNNGKIILAGQTASTKTDSAPAQVVKVSGIIRASAPASTIQHQGNTVVGGFVEITGEEIQVSGADIDVSGSNGGGTVLLGGDYLGGGEIKLNMGLEDIREDYDVATASIVKVDKATNINASATELGDGGKVILWSEDLTSFAGWISAQGSGEDNKGGFIETSSGNELSVLNANVIAGSGGTWLLDPKYINIGNSDQISGDNQFVSANTIETALNSGTTVKLLATGENAEISVNSDIRKTTGGDAQLLLGSTGSILVDADIISTSGKLDIGFITADVSDNFDDANSQLLSVPSGRLEIEGGHLINTNGGNFGFQGAEFVALGASQFVLDQADEIIPPTRILTKGGSATFVFSPKSVSGLTFATAFGCSGSTTECGLGTNFQIETGAGQVGFAVNTDYSLQGASDIPVVLVGDQGIKTEGELVLNNVALFNYVPSPSRNGIHNVEIGSLRLLNDAVFGLEPEDYSSTIDPLISEPPIVSSTFGFSFEQGQTANGFEIPVATMFSDDGGTENLNISIRVNGSEIQINDVVFGNLRYRGVIDGKIKFEFINEQANFDVGDNSIEITATDEGNNSVTSTVGFSITEPPVVVPQNTPPVPVTGVTLPNGTYVVGEEFDILLPELFTDDGVILNLKVFGPTDGNFQIIEINGQYHLVGRFTGDPGTISLTFRASDNSGASTSLVLQMSIVAAPVDPEPPVDNAPVAISGTVSLPNAQSGVAYNQTTQVLFSDDQALSGLTLVTTNLPAGLVATPNDNGTVTITGTPTVSGNLTFTVTATDVGGNSTSSNLALSINDPVITEPPVAPPLVEPPSVVPVIINTVALDGFGFVGKYGQNYSSFISNDSILEGPSENFSDIQVTFIEGVPEGMIIDVLNDGRLTFSGEYNPNRGGVFGDPKNLFEVNFVVYDPVTETTSSGSFRMFFRDGVSASIENPQLNFEIHAPTLIDVSIDTALNGLATVIAIPGGSLATYTISGTSVVIAYGSVKLQADRNVLSSLDRWSSKIQIETQMLIYSDAESWLDLAANGYIKHGGKERDVILALMYLRALDAGVDANRLKDFFNGIPLPS